MLKKSLIISVLAIALLLIVQLVWLSLVIKDEKHNYEQRVNELVEQVVKKELVHRRSYIKKKNTTFVSKFVSSKDLKKEDYNKYTLSAKDVGNNDFINVTVDHFHQVYQKDVGHPFSVGVFSKILANDLDSLGMGTCFSVYYSDFNLQKIFHYKSDKLCFNKSFTVETFLTVTKNMKVTVVVYFPLSVYQGKFLSITLFSFVLLLLIIYLLIMQFRILSEQQSLARVKENLTRFFTHELRSPLQTALSGVEMLEDAAKNGDIESQKRYSKVVLDKLLYINGFIERMLDINKLKYSRVRVNRERFNLLDVAKRVTAEFSTNNSKDIDIKIDKSCDIEVFADIEHIYNALSNLVGNAVKYSRDSVGIKLEVKRNRKYTEISVEDNGIGIPEADQKMIFDQFYRVNDSGRNIKGKGFGLGLNYVKWVAESHRGRVLVRSKPGEGSRFTLIISNI